MKKYSLEKKLEAKSPLQKGGLVIVSLPDKKSLSTIEVLRYLQECEKKESKIIIEIDGEQYSEERDPQVNGRTPDFVVNTRGFFKWNIIGNYEGLDYMSSQEYEEHLANMSSKRNNF